MRIILDTNILVSSSQPNHPQRSITNSAILALTERGESLCTVPQVFYEFWVVATRPVGSENGLGLSGPEARARLDQFAQAFSMLDDSPESSLRSEWAHLVIQFDVKGKAAHDARLVAAMKVYDVATILTYNKSHFARYPGIVAVTPEEATALPR